LVVALVVFEEVLRDPLRPQRISGQEDAGGDLARRGGDVSAHGEKYDGAGAEVRWSRRAKPLRKGVGRVRNPYENAWRAYETTIKIGVRMGPCPSTSTVPGCTTCATSTSRSRGTVWSPSQECPGRASRRWRSERFTARPSAATSTRSRRSPAG